MSSSHFGSKTPRIGKDLPQHKELHFFDLNYQKELSWYKLFFPYKWSNKKSGEASPYYLFHPHAAQRIKDICPQIKLIVLLRNPVDRAYSHYQMQKRKGTETLSSFTLAIEQEANRLKGQLECFNKDPFYHSLQYRKFSYLSRGKYVEQIKRWFQCFPQEQFLFIKSEFFFETPLQELVKVYDFLNIDQSFPEDIRPSKKGQYEEMTLQIRKKLDHYFDQENHQLPDLIGDDFVWTT